MLVKLASSTALALSVSFAPVAARAAVSHADAPPEISAERKTWGVGPLPAPENSRTVGSGEGAEASPEDVTHATVLAKALLDQIRSAVKKGSLSLAEAKELFGTSAPHDFDQAVSGNLIPLVSEDAARYSRLFQYEVAFGAPPKTEKLDDLVRVGLQKLTVRVSWPSDEPDLQSRHRVVLVTFVKFQR